MNLRFNLDLVNIAIQKKGKHSSPPRKTSVPILITITEKKNSIFTGTILTIAFRNNTRLTDTKTFTILVTEGLNMVNSSDFREGRLRKCFSFRVRRLSSSQILFMCEVITLPFAFIFVCMSFNFDILARSLLKACEN